MDLLAQLGVSRVARVTGLDRSGVEVACAVRPGGHVLQVVNGKGLRWERARAAALSEAAELWAAERVTDLLAEPDAETVVPAASALFPARIAWKRGRELIGGGRVCVPAQAVHCPPQGAPPLGPAAFRWSSNGMGAHPRRAAALQHALLELVERDQLARALPAGFTEEALARRALRELPAGVAALAARLLERRLRAVFFDVSGPLGVPVAGALLLDEEEGPVPVAAGYAAGLTPAAALLGALLEAAQSRLTDVHGAREDVAPMEDARGFAEAVRALRPRRSWRTMPVVRAPLVEHLRARGVRRVAAVTLATAPIFVVKLVAPEFLVSELL